MTGEPGLLLEVGLTTLDAFFGKTEREQRVWGDRQAEARGGLREGTRCRCNDSLPPQEPRRTPFSKPWSPSHTNPHAKKKMRDWNHFQRIIQLCSGAQSVVHFSARRKGFERAGRGCRRGMPEGVPEAIAMFEKGGIFAKARAIHLQTMARKKREPSLLEVDLSSLTLVAGLLTARAGIHRGFL